MQNHYREVLQWEMFMTLELDFGRLALLTIWADYEQPLRPFFKGFVVKKKRE